MATKTEEFLVGNGTQTLSFTTQYIKESDIKVRVNGGSPLAFTTGTPTTGQYNIASNATSITFGDTYSNTDTIHIYSETDVSAPTVSFSPGSSIKAADLNKIETLVRHGIKENRNQIITPDIRDSQITSAKIVDGTIVDADISSSAAISQSKIATGTLPSGVKVSTANIIDLNLTTDKIADSNVTTAKIADENITTGKIAPDAVTGAKIADRQVDSEHIVVGGIDHEHLANDIIDGDNIQDDVINSEHYAPVSIDTEHIANENVTTAKIANQNVTTPKIADLNVTTGKIADQHVTTAKIADLNVTTGKIADDAVTDAKIADGTLDGRYYTETELDAGQLDNRYFTETELTNGALDGRYFTETEADARYFNISSGETIKDGDTFPDNDTTIATTAAINDRIIDIVNDVGGFDILASEQHFPNDNPQGQAGSAAVLSIKAASTALTPTGTTLTIANGNIANNANITITGVTSVIPQGFGFLVESTATLHTYTFHRLVPKATEVTTVAGISGNVTTVAGISADTTTVAGIASDVTTVAGIDSDVTAVAANNANITAVKNNETNINAVQSNATNINTVSGSIANVNTAATNIASINNASANISSVNNFGDQYQVASSPPTTDGGGNALSEGDLYFDTTADELKVYSGSAWQGGVTASGNFAATTGNTFTGSNTYQDNAKAIFGTGQDLEIHHTGLNSIINDAGTGSLLIQTGGGTKLEVQSSGIGVTGNITVSGNVDGRDVAADGSNLDTIRSGDIGTTMSNGNIQLSPNGTGVVEVRGAGGADGTLQLNCSAQSHGIKLKSPPHSAGASYTLTFPDSVLNNGLLKSDTNGNLSFTKVNTVNLNNDVVTNAKLADNAVNTSQLVDGSVNADKLDGNAVTTAKIASGAITTARLADDAVTDAKLADDASNDSNRAVGTNHIKSSAVETRCIKDGAVTALKMGTFSVTASAMSADAVSDFSLSDHSTDNSLRAVNTNHIKDSAVTDAKIVSLSSSKLTGALPALDGSALTGLASAEVYGFHANASGNLIQTTTNGGADNISASTYAAFEQVLLTASGFSYSVNANGNLIVTI